MKHKIPLLLLSTSLLTACGSYNISIEKNEEQEQVAPQQAQTAQTTEQAAQQTSKSAQTASKQAPAPSSQIIQDNSGNYVQASEDANIRKSPDINSSIVKSAKSGDVFEYLHEKVQTSDNRTWLKVRYGSSGIGYISQKVGNVSASAPGYVRLLENGTNIRTDTSTTSSIVATGNAGDTIAYTGYSYPKNDGRIWLEVVFDDGTVGYVSQKVATLTTTGSGSLAANSSNNYSVVVVTANEANIRSNTDKDDTSAIIEKASKGERFDYTGYTFPDNGRDWHEVYSSTGEIGYISSRVGRLQ